LSKLGVSIVRFSDKDILTNIEGVYKTIERALEKKKTNPLTLILSPQGRGKVKIIPRQEMYNAFLKSHFQESAGFKRCLTG